MLTMKQLGILTAVTLLVSCGGGSSVDSEVIRVDDDDTPVDGGGDVATPVEPGDVVSTEQLTASDSFEMKPSKEVSLKVDLPESFGGATVVLCVSDTVVSAADVAQINFNDCLYSGKLSSIGQAETGLEITNTVPYLTGAVIASGEDPIVENWQNVSAGQTLLINSGS